MLWLFACLAPIRLLFAMRNSLILSDVCSPSEWLPSLSECGGLLRAHDSSKNTHQGLLASTPAPLKQPTPLYCLDNGMLRIDNTLMQKISMTIRVDAADKEKWEQSAKSAGMGLSEWIRERCNEGFAVDRSGSVSRKANKTDSVRGPGKAAPAKDDGVTCSHDENPGKCPYPLCKNYGRR